VLGQWDNQLNCSAVGNVDDHFGHWYLSVKIRTSNYLFSNLSNILQAFVFYSVAVRYLYLALHLLCNFYSSCLVCFVLFLSYALKCFSVIGIPATCWISPQNVIQLLLKVQELYTAGIEYRRNRLTDTVNSISPSLCFYWTCGIWVKLLHLRTFLFIARRDRMCKRRHARELMAKNKCKTWSYRRNYFLVVESFSPIQVFLFYGSIL